MTKPSSTIKSTDLEKAHTLYLATQPSLDSVKKLAEFIFKKETSYPGFMERLAIEYRDVSYEKLGLYFKIGAGQLYAPVMAHLGNDNVRRIVDWDYATQEKVMESGVDVLRGDKMVRMSIFDLNPNQRAQVLDCVRHRVRTEKEQHQRLFRPKMPRIKPNSDSRVLIDPESKKAFVRPNHGLSAADIISIGEKIMTIKDVLTLLNRVRQRDLKLKAA